jgi:hypothetical protein
MIDPRSEIQQRLDALTAASRQTKQAQSDKDGQAKLKAEEVYNMHLEWLDKHSILFFFSSRAKCYIQQRYHLVITGDDGSNDLWTMIDTRASKPVLYPPGSLKVGQPVLLNMPMESRQHRINAEKMCESWNLLESGHCGCCGQKITEGNYPGEFRDDLVLCYEGASK